MSKKIKLIRKLKALFLKYRLHTYLPGKGLLFLGQMSDLSKWAAGQKNLSYTEFPTLNFDYNKRYNLYEFLLEKEKLNTNVDYLEFGVSRGFSFRWWVEKINHPEARFYGFDTFTGLPEDWGPFKKGEMSNGNKMPEINDPRHSFYQGIFQDTLGTFLKTYEAKKRKIIHLDADLYSSTLFVLTSISSYLRPNDILIFDEFNVPMHEFKAFKEWTESFYIKYEVLAEVNNFYQVAFKIK